MKESKAIKYFSDRLANEIGADVSVREFQGPRSFCIGQDVEQFWICINGGDRFLCQSEDELITKLIALKDGIDLYKTYKGGK